jgi:hypothetical protein
MPVISASSEISFLYKTVVASRLNGTGADGMWQLAPVYCSIPYRPGWAEELHALEEKIRSEIPWLYTYGSRRARKAYSSTKDTITKPSYRSRIEGPNQEWDRNQLDSIQRIFDSEPHSGGLVFSVFHPIDLENRYRPGYVPCLVSGSFVVHGQALQLNAFFRSQSVLEFGLYDLQFLRELQERVCGRFRTKSGFRKLEPGSLNLAFGRIIVQRRIARRRTKDDSGKLRHSCLPREVVVSRWLEILRSVVGREDREFYKELLGPS